MRHLRHVAASVISLGLIACAAEDRATGARPIASPYAARSVVVDPLVQEVESSAYQEDTASPAGSTSVAIPDPGLPSPLTEQVDDARPQPDAGEAGNSRGALSASASAATDNDLLLRAPAEETGPDALSRRLGRQGHDAASATRAVESLGTGRPSAQAQTAPVPPDGALIIVPAGGGTPVIVTRQGG